MALENRNIAKEVAKAPCVWCGWTSSRRQAAVIISEAKEKNADWNTIPLCPNCNNVFGEVVKPLLYKALQAYGCEGLPDSWSKDNKTSN